MITTIQACEERLEYIQPIAKELDAIVHVDKRRINAFWSFKDMLDIDVTDYRLHLQDDVIIADELKTYFSYIENFMYSHNIHLLALFAPSRKSFSREYFLGKHIVEYRNYLGNMGVVFSKHFVEKMRTYIKITSQTMDDDIFINEVLSRSSITGFAHFPTLVQHDIKLDSLIGHEKDKFYSNLFEKDYITKLNLEKTNGR